MNENYIEYSFKREKTLTMRLIECIILASIVCIGFISLFAFIFIPIEIGLIAIYIYLRHYFDQEYEYIFLDDTLTISKIYHQSKRKDVAYYTLNGLEKITTHIPNNKQLKYYHSRINKDPQYAFIYSNHSGFVIQVNQEIKNMLQYKYYRYMERGM